MIRFSKKEDTVYLNKLLIETKSSYNKSNQNPFCKCIVSDDINIKGALFFEEIYEKVDIDYIIVSNNYRRQGIASKLLEYLIDYCKKKNISNITLEVNENNIPAINLYKKYEFEIVATRKNYYKEEDGLLMIRKFESNE